MSGRKNHLAALIGAVLVLALVTAPVSAAHEGRKSNNKGSTESKTHNDNNSNGSTEAKTNSDNKSKGSASSEAGKASGGNKASGGKKSPVPGNNGTIKIDGEPFDTTRNNEPHVGCDFRVLYFGTDEGEGLTSTLTFEAHSPTDGDFTFTDTITLGAGEPDIAGPYNLVAGLQAAGIEPHPQQGYHVKLTTNTEYSQGADVKHKVFWIQCDESEQQADVLGSSLESDGKTAAKGAPARSDEAGAEVLGSGLSRDSGAEVAGAAAERGPSVAGENAEVAGGVLPFTGASVMTFLMIALGLVAAGFAFLKLRRGNV